MARKPEARFREGVHNLLPKTLYRQSMYTPYSAGTPDMYYEGDRHLWVEWKYLPNYKDFLIDDLLSPRQLVWAQRALKNNQPWIAIVGLGKEKGGVVCSKLGMRTNKILTRPQLAELIWHLTMQNALPEVSASPKRCPPTVMGSRRLHARKVRSCAKTPSPRARSATRSVGTTCTTTSGKRRSGGSKPSRTRSGKKR